MLRTNLSRSLSSPCSQTCKLRHLSMSVELCSWRLVYWWSFYHLSRKEKQACKEKSDSTSAFGSSGLAGVGPTLVKGGMVLSGTKHLLQSSQTHPILPICESNSFPLCYICCFYQNLTELLSCFPSFQNL